MIKSIIFDISSASLIVDGENYILKDGDGFIFDSKTGQYVPYNGKYIDVNDDEPMTIAAHFDGDEYTDAELEEIRKFAEFVKSKRKE